MILLEEGGEAWQSNYHVNLLCIPSALLIEQAEAASYEQLPINDAEEFR
jgi:hypothetical protein